MGVSEIIAISAEDHISVSYARPGINFDYARMWTEAGGVRRGNHYVIPFEAPSKPLSETVRGHRSRTRRKRLAKGAVRKSIEKQLRNFVGPPY